MPVGIPEYLPVRPSERQLLDKTGCPIFIKRLDQTFTFANPAFCALYPGCRIVGSNGQALFGNRQAAQFLKEDRQCVREGTLTTEWRGPDGRRFLVQKVALPSERGVPSIGAMLFDVTDYRDESADALEEMRVLKAEAEAKALLLAEAAEKIEYVSLHDAHTGLANRRYLERRLDTVRDTGETVAVLTVDLDKFKQINDSAGHFAGDHVLRHVASTMTKATRLGDFVARVGGDEFTVICDYDDDPEPVMAIAEMMLRMLDEPINYRGQSLRTGVSIGVALPDDAGPDIDTLLVGADLALYRAKSAGRGRVVRFRAAMQQELREEERRIAAFETALERGEIRAHYQPQIRASTGELVGVEALARWYHPEQGVLPPGAFLETAEMAEKLAELDAAILHTAGAEFAKLHSTRADVPRLSVNISAAGLERFDLLTEVDELGLPRGALTIELLETILFDAAEADWRLPVDSLRERGVGIAIDDFGTGRASIISLLSVGPDLMKIDRQFVADLADSDEARQVVTAMIDIGRALKIDVLAEGVETAEQARILVDLGCDILQGWLFGQAAPPADLPALFDRPASYWRDLMSRGKTERFAS